MFGLITVKLLTNISDNAFGLRDSVQFNQWSGTNSMQNVGNSLGAFWVTKKRKLF